MMLAIVSAQFAPGGDELIEAFVQNSGWERCLASGAWWWQVSSQCYLSMGLYLHWLSRIRGVEEIKNLEKPAKESFSLAIFLSEISPFRHQLPSHPQPVQLDTEEFVARPASPFLAPIWEESRVWSGVEGA